MAIEVRHLSKRFDSFVAVDDVSFNVPRGSLAALLGPSGGGKSTILRLIAGLETADTGEVLLDGEPVDALHPRERQVGFVFQHYALFRHMTVVQNIGFGLMVKKVPKKEIREQVEHLLKLVGLAGFGNRYPNQLSGGQRQRVALARALAPKPRLLLLDEPFGAVDAKVREELGEWLRLAFTSEVFWLKTILDAEASDEVVAAVDALSPTAATRGDGLGVYAQVGVLAVKDLLELALRFDWVDEQIDTAGSRFYPAFGVNLYIKGHNLKLQSLFRTDIASGYEESHSLAREQPSYLVELMLQAGF